MGLSQTAFQTFLSTLPVRGATAERRAASEAHAISIHAPREGSDKGRFDFYHPMLAFLSTLPVRGATAGRAQF